MIGCPLTALKSNFVYFLCHIPLAEKTHDSCRLQITLWSVREGLQLADGSDESLFEVFEVVFGERVLSYPHSLVESPLESVRSDVSFLGHTGW